MPLRSHDKVRAFKRDVKVLLWDTAVADQGVVLCADCNQIIHTGRAG